MKFTLSWLKDYLDTSASVDEIAAGLLGIGLEVEEISDKTKALSAFTVAHVTVADKHPNADKLRLCVVETKDGTKQVVCGAPNARSGIKAIVALPGVTIPVTGQVFAPATIRGSESQAMLCSERELLLSEEHDGIIEVQGDWPVGTPAATALGLDDPMFYVKVTANRPDALGIYGIARDLAAKGLGTLKPLNAPVVKGSFDSAITVKLDLPAVDAKACSLFVGRHIRGVKNGPSPAWLQQRLKAIGLRPISTLVDITNYITFAYGRPLHVFDASKVHGNISARLAKEGETIDALDNKSYSLSAGMTVIADDKGPEGIAGIIGGIASSCTDETTEVFLEAAYFDPVRTATTGRKLGINSDARYRFERGIDPAFTQTGAEIATQMILDLCGGEASHLVIAGKVPDAKRAITLRRTLVKQLGGLDCPWAEQLKILRALGFVVTDAAAGASCMPPTWRPDVNGEADLVEEICRVVGLENIPYAEMERPSAVARPVLTPLQKRMLASRRTLAARGFHEAVTYAFLPTAQAKLFGGGQRELQLANAISSELTDMRPSLLPNLVAAAGRNMARGFSNFALGEVGHAYSGDTLEQETLRAAGLRQGSTAPKQWLCDARAVDAFDMKADVLAVLEACGMAASTLQIVQGAPVWFHPGRSGTVQMGPKNQLAWFGELHPAVLMAMDVKGPILAFEIVLNAIPAPKQKGTAKAALVLSDLMPLSRDYAFVVEPTVQAGEVLKAARGADRALIADAQVFDVFKLPDGKLSLAVSVTLQPKDKTLTEEEIDFTSKKIIAAVSKATGAVLRG
jgi:phenylalanyl-tRNA synthetase beta chain